MLFAVLFLFQLTLSLFLFLFIPECFIVFSFILSCVHLILLYFLFFVTLLPVIMPVLSGASPGRTLEGGDVRHGDTAAVPNYVLNNFICTLNDYDVWLGRYVA